MVSFELPAREETVEIGSLCHYLQGFLNLHPMQSLDGSDIPNNYKTLYVMGILSASTGERRISSEPSTVVQPAMCNVQCAMSPVGMS